MCAISVVLPTDSLRTIEPVLRALQQQTIADQIEVLLVSTELSALEGAERYREPFAGLRTLTSDSIAPLGVARGAGIRAARGEWVFIGETHSFLMPDALELLLQRGTDDWDVVVPGFLNQNPGSLLSWASFLAAYNKWNRALPEGPIDEAPPYDSLIRRKMLIELSPGLDAILLDAELLRESLRAAGARIFLESRAGMRHTNIELVGAIAHEHILIGRAIGAQRSQTWSLARRLLYLAATPAVPWILLRRARPGVRAARSRWGLDFRFELAVLLPFTFKAIGEGIGLLGARWGEAQQAAMSRYEVRRFDFVHESSRSHDVNGVLRENR